LRAHGYTSSAMMSVIILQHAPSEAPGTILEALARASIAFEIVHTGHGQQPVPSEIGAAQGLIVMGGPMGVYETEAHPYLRDELALLELALARDVPVLGVCLGSQLLAAALGARVYPSGHKELGWHGVHLKPAAASCPLFAGLPERFDALHWHGDAFDLPRSARSLAASELTEHQAFAYGAHAFGLLFHLEATLPQVEAMAAAFPDELVEAGVGAADLLRRTELALPELQPLAATVFGGFAALVASR
jgi:GMP synthase (glutamine-hydrolysing)